MLEDLNYEERREWARMLYTQQDHTIHETAVAVSIDEATVRNWINDGAWDGVRRSLLISKHTQIRHFYDQIEKLNAKIKENPGEINTKEVDLICKYTTAIKNLEVDISAPQIIEVAMLFVKWLKPKNLQLTKTVTACLDKFIKEKLAIS
jgi:hypothetical protein